MLLSCDNMGYKVALPFYNFNSAQEGLIKLSLNTLKLVNHAHLFFFPIIINLSIITNISISCCVTTTFLTSIIIPRCWILVYD